MNLQEIINAATESYLKEKLPSKIEEHIGKCIEGIFEQMFKSYEPLAKEIKTKIEAAIDVNLQQFDLMDYNGMISNMIVEKIQQHGFEYSIQPIEKMVKKHLGFFDEKEIRFSDLIDTIVQNSMEENEMEGEGEISLFIEENDRFGWFIIYVDSEADCEQNECSIQFTISKDGKILTYKTKRFLNEKAEKLNHENLKTAKMASEIIFRVYSAGVKVIMDITDEDDLKYWSKY